MGAHRELLYLRTTYPESHDPLNVGWAGGWRLRARRGRQYTLSFNSVHRITQGPLRGGFRRVRSLPARAPHSPTPPEPGGEPRVGVGGGGTGRSTSPFKGDGEYGRFFMTPPVVINGQF